MITLPHSVMSYMTTEMYALTIPMFVPSPKFFMSFADPTKQQYGLGYDRTSTSYPYCQGDPKLEEKMRPLPNSTNSIHVYSPNIDCSEDVESEQYWLQFSDFYDWPHIQHFDSYDHLKDMLLHSDLRAIHKAMQQEMEIRREQVVAEWCKIIMRIGEYKNN